MNTINKHADRPLITRNVPSLESRAALRKFNLAINVKRYTTDPNGTILLPGAVPAHMQIPFPFHLFGEFDRYSGYAVANLASRDIENRTILFSTYVHGIGTPLFFFSPFNTINSVLKKGDVIFLYVDDLNAPNFFTFVVVSALQGGYASLTSQSNITQLDGAGYWGVFKMFDVEYSWINDAQLSHPILSVHTKFNSAYKYDSINVRAYYPAELKAPVKTLHIPWEMVVNQYCGITSFIDFLNPVLNLSFNLYI